MSPTRMRQSPSSRGWADRASRGSSQVVLTAFQVHSPVKPWWNHDCSLRGYLSQVMGCPGQHHHKEEGVTGIPPNGQPWPPRHSFCPLEGSSSTGIPLWERDIPHPYLLIQKQKPAQAWRQISCRWGGGRKDGKVSNITCYKGFDFTS